MTYEALHSYVIEGLRYRYELFPIRCPDITPDIGTSRHDTGYQIPDIGIDIGFRIEYPDIGMLRIPISGSKSGSILGIPMSGT
jgi:hypothetical protein